jgi:hypothetical protein
MVFLLRAEPECAFSTMWLSTSTTRLSFLHTAAQNFGMALNPETQAFSGRLKQALTRSPRQIRTPFELAPYFNLNHAGQ